MKNRVNLFLDSGAHSAYTRGAKINLQDYIDFIKEHKEFISLYACLDVIGYAEKTYENQLEMERQGLNPMVVFHYGEDTRWLRLYLDKYDYIGLGSRSRKKLDEYWNIICDTPDRMPRCKVHGFGIGSTNLIRRYPWYSVDATSWVTSSFYGSVYVPPYKNGKWVYDRKPWKIAVSNRSTAIKKVGQHIRNLSEMERNLVLKYFASIGYSLGKSEFRKEKANYELKDKDGVEVSPANQQIPEGDSGGFRNYFACNPGKGQPERIMRMGGRNLLISFVDMMDKSSEVARSTLERIVGIENEPEVI